MRRCLCVFFIAVLIFSGGCSAERPRAFYETVDYTDYKDIPGVTAEEIEAIDHLRAAGAKHIFGMPEGVSCFTGENGEPDGYSVLFCEWLSGLFGIDVIPVIYEWDELVIGVYSRAISFTGALPASDGDETIGAGPIAERTVITITRDDEADRPDSPVYGFIMGSGIEGLIAPLTGYRYTAEYFPSYTDAYERLMDLTVDAILTDSDAEAVFFNDPEITIEKVTPAVYNMVSFLTADPALAPVVSVVQRYLESGASYRLFDLNAKGWTAYLRKKLIMMLNEDEREYFDLHRNPAAVIPIALESQNYPNSFYNETEGEWQGIAVDILKEIQNITGFTFSSISSKRDNWSTTLGMLENGSVAMINELIRIPSREGGFLWSDPAYQVDYYALLSSADIPDINIGQVNHLRIGVLSNTAYAEMFYELFPGHPDTIVYNSNYDGFNALNKGEVDLLMATHNLLLNATNYMEITGIKANLVLDRTYDSQFGFNINQSTLRSIVSKTQSLIDTDSYIDHWIRRVFDYRGKMARSQVPYLITASAMLGLILILITLFLIRNRRMGKQLERTVDERTLELRNRTSELEIQTNMAQVASQSKSDFLARMSHEIRTPLNAIIGMTRIAMGTAGDEKTKSSLGEISTASNHLLGILNDVLDMSKIESGKFILSEENFALRTAMTEVKKIIGQRCDEKHIDLSVNFKDMQDYVVTGDKLRLKQILINLLGNAVKFTPEGGSISFLADIVSEDDSAVTCRFTVNDTGIGMTEAQMSKLFIAFEQTDKNIAVRYGGTGLGLTISQTLVGYMGGEITVTSEPDLGSSFTFALTLHRAASAEERNDTESETPPDLAGKRLMIVDDVEINRLILAEILADTNITTEEVCDGLRALELFYASPIDHFNMILMDIQMPEMDGYRATEAIRASERPDAKLVPIIAMTANAYKEDIEAALESGMNGHLAKPIDVDALMRTMRLYLCSGVEQKI